VETRFEQTGPRLLLTFPEILLTAAQDLEIEVTA
jgi:hypothetical protein